MHAWFSQKQAELAGTNFYARADGAEVEVSQVGASKEGAPCWDDTVYVGEVARWVRKGRRPTEKGAAWLGR